MVLNSAIAVLRAKWNSKDGICLVLGAGVSVPSGMPSWSQLIALLYFKKLNNKIWEQFKPYSNYLRAAAEHFLRARNEIQEISAEKIRESMGYAEFHKEIHRCLYLGIESDQDYLRSIERNSLLNSIASLCESRRPSAQGKGLSNGGVRAILTYNYDDLVERQLRIGGIPTQVITGSTKAGWSDESLPIHHVHGYVPFVADGNEGDVVLAESSYYEMSAKNISWQHIVHVTCLAGSTCLLVGLSLNDLSLRRYLHSIADSPLRGEHVAILKRPDPISISKEDWEKIDRRALELLHIKGSGRKSIEGPAVIEAWLMEAQSEDERDQVAVLGKLGITIIWVDKHEEIPGIVSSIGR